jgi:hypothetical protein
VNAANDTQLAQYQQNAVNPGAASSATTGGTGTGTANAASSTSTSCPTTTSGGSGYAKCGAGFSAAQVVPGVLMTVLGGSFGALLM